MTTSQQTPPPDGLAATDGYDDAEMCPRCKCCELFWETCECCGGEGVSGHDCGEDCCCCLEPEDNMRCDYCMGKGGHWSACSCDENGKHDHNGKGQL